MNRTISDNSRQLEKLKQHIHEEATASSIAVAEKCRGFADNTDTQVMKVLKLSASTFTFAQQSFELEKALVQSQHTETIVTAES